MGKKDEKQKAELIKFMNGRKIPRQVGMPERLNDLLWHRKLLIELGFRPRDKGDFFEVTFPKGWKKEIVLDSEEWFFILDAKGRRRMAIFFKMLTKHKASSFINYVACYNIRTKVEGDEVVATFGSEFDSFFTIREKLITDKKVDRKKYQKEVNEVSNYLAKKLDDFAKENYPDYQNILAYWEGGNDVDLEENKN